MALGKETTQGKDGWFPSIIGPNEKNVGRHYDGDMQIEPTPAYDAKLAYFRKNPASADTEKGN